MLDEEHQKLEHRINELYGILLDIQEAIRVTRIMICLFVGANIGILLVLVRLLVN